MCPRPLFISWSGGTAGTAGLVNNIHENEQKVILLWTTKKTLVRHRILVHIGHCPKIKKKKWRDLETSRAFFLFILALANKCFYIIQPWYVCLLCATNTTREAPKKKNVDGEAHQTNDLLFSLTRLGSI